MSNGLTHLTDGSGILPLYKSIFRGHFGFRFRLRSRLLRFKIWLWFVVYVAVFGHFYLLI